jgi:hypothetical protein
MNCEESSVLRNILTTYEAYDGISTNKLGSVVDLLMNARRTPQVGTAAVNDEVEPYRVIHTVLRYYALQSSEVPEELMNYLLLPTFSLIRYFFIGSNGSL